VAHPDGQVAVVTDVVIEPNPSRFIPASMIAAQMCVRCGSLVGGEGKQAHLDFHREIDLAALNGEPAAAPDKAKKKVKK
jgi:hypothetical protein